MRKLFGVTQLHPRASLLCVIPLRMKELLMTSTHSVTLPHVTGRKEIKTRLFSPAEEKFREPGNAGKPNPLRRQAVMETNGMLLTKSSHSPNPCAL